MKRRWFHLLACLAVLAGTLFAVQGSPARQATPAASTAGLSLAASGLENPRGFTWGADGTLYVAQAAVTDAAPGSATPIATPGPLTGGLDGSIVSIGANGCPVLFQGNLPSAGGNGGPDLGPDGLAFVSGQLYVLDEGGGASHGNPLTPDGVYLIPGDGSAKVVADIGAWVQANPVANPPADPDADGDLTAMVAQDTTLLVLESNGGQVLEVTLDGAVSRLADLSDNDQRPAGIAIGTDGQVYVGVGSKVVAIASDGTTSDAWTGLGAVVDVAVASDGTLYAVQQDGTVVRQTSADASSEVANGFDAPAAMAFGPDGGLYVSSPMSGGDPTAGSVVRLDTAEGEIIAMSDSILTGSPCISTPTPTSTPATTPDGTPTGTPDGTPGGDPTGVSVEIKNFAFNPNSISVSTGATVTWTNNDTVAHTVTATDGSFDSGNIAPGETFTHTFTDAGTFDYMCSYHPNMTGTVTVSADGGASGAATTATTTASDATATPGDATPAASGSQDSAVSIKDFAFGPDSLSVAAGTTVTWTNNDTVAHTVTANDGSFDSGNLAPGATFTHTFTTAGTVDYHCDYHPNMTASVTVT